MPEPNTHAVNDQTHTYPPIVFVNDQSNRATIYIYTNTVAARNMQLTMHWAEGKDAKCTLRTAQAGNYPNGLVELPKQHKPYNQYKRQRPSKTPDNVIDVTSTTYRSQCATRCDEVRGVLKGFVTPLCRTPIARRSRCTLRCCLVKSSTFLLFISHSHFGSNIGISQTLINAV